MNERAIPETAVQGERYDEIWIGDDRAVTNGDSRWLRRIVVPDSSMPEIAGMPRRHRGQLRIAIGDALKFEQLCAAPGPHELAMSVGIVFLGWRSKPPLRECGVDLKDELDVTAFDEV